MVGRSGEAVKFWENELSVLDRCSKFGVLVIDWKSVQRDVFG